MRDHQPIPLDKFKGLWRRGDADNTPLNHFADGNNLRVMGDDWATRYGVGIAQDVALPLENIKRIYNYPTQTANTLLVLTYDGTDGEIYHVVDSTTIFGPILTVTGMTDFAFVPYAGRAYISPFGTFDTGELNIQKGLENEFVYVYLGDGVTARKAAGAIPTAGSLTIANGTGATDAGLHLFAVIYEFDTGYLTAPARFTSFNTSASNGVSFSNIPTSPSANVVARHIVATKVITNYNGNTTGYTYYFIPDGTINNNTATVLNNVTFFDIDLLEDASHLLDNFTEIPAGAILTLYNDRLVVGCTFDDISAAWASARGEPEAISEVDGLIIFPLDGNPLTNLQELRDVLYGFKRSKTGAWVDNNEEPSSWEFSLIDPSLGCPVHGIATVIDSGGVSIDYLIVATFGGLQLFTGRYIAPELTFKIQDLWLEQNRNLFRRIQILNNTIQKEIYCILPDGRLLVGNYQEGLDSKNIKWMTYSFNIWLNSVAMINIDELILGAEVID